MSITTKDLARICGVSRTTISRALHDQSRISLTTKEMILQKAKELDYRPDLLARGLVKGKTMYIGIVMFDVNNRYFSQMLSVIEMEAKRKGYFVNITLHEKDKTMEYELINSLVSHRVDGIILSPVNKGKDFDVFIQKLGIPVLLIGNKVSDKIPFVGIDEQKAATEATAKLVGRQYERIVFVCPPLSDEKEENIYSHEERKKGFLSIMNKNKHIEAVIIDSWNYLNDVESYINTSHKKTAFFCSGDIFALELFMHLKSKGKRVPQDFGIMGFDNIDTLRYVTPKMSTIHNSVEKVSIKAVQLLFDMLDGKEISSKTIIDYKIIEGETI